MNDDQLRDRIGRLDPLTEADGASIHPITSPAARSLLETVMNRPLTEDHPTDSPTDSPTHHPTATRSSGTRRWTLTAGVAAAAVAVLAIGAFAFTGDGDGPDVAAPATTLGEPDAAKPTVLELSSGTDDIMASCIAVDSTFIAQSPVAFKGTVTMAEHGVVQLTVDEAYAGVDEQVATLSAPEGMEALIGGVAWDVGVQYLVSAWEGVVSYCGMTGPATPELQAMYDEAFGR